MPTDCKQALSDLVPYQHTVLHTLLFPANTTSSEIGHIAGIHSPVCCPQILHLNLRAVIGPLNTTRQECQRLRGCRPYELVEQGLREYYGNNSGSPVPRELLREHLSDALSSGSLRQTIDLGGNRVCAARLSEGLLLLGHCCGAIRQLPMLSALSTKHLTKEVKVRRSH